MKNSAFRRFLGLDDKEDAGIRVSMVEATLPLDMVLELVIRQQNQLFKDQSELGQRIEVNEQVLGSMGESIAHLHNDLVELRQVLENAAKHPVERVDEETEEKSEPEKKRKLIN